MSHFCPPSWLELLAAQGSNLQRSVMKMARGCRRGAHDAPRNTAALQAADLFESLNNYQIHRPFTHD